MLALTFATPSDYDKILEDDVISIEGLKSFAPGKQLQLVVKHKDGSTHKFALNHTFNAEQIKWFRAGSALNLLSAKS